MVSRIVSLRCKSAHLEISPPLQLGAPMLPASGNEGPMPPIDRSVTHFRTPRKFAFQQKVFQLGDPFARSRASTWNVVINVGGGIANLAGAD